MMSEEDLEEKYKTRGGYIVGYTLYLPIDMAEEYMMDCRENMLAIIGIEGFRLQGGKHLADIDLIADFSSYLEDKDDWSKIVDSSYKDAMNFVKYARMKGAGLLTFTLCTEDERSILG
jgi:hypothetical protein